MPARSERLCLMAEDRQPNPFLAALGRALEAALNRGVALDADMRNQLAGLEGRRIGIELRGANLALAITVRDGRLQVGPHWDAPGDLNLHASPGSLLAFALRRGDDTPGRSPSAPGRSPSAMGRSPSAAKAMDGRERPAPNARERPPLPAGKVEISGDAELARRVEKLLRGFRPDIEEAFARTFGDVLGVPLARALHSAFAWTRESAQSFAEDSAAFLRDDTRDLVAKAQVEAFLDEVDTLRERADRLAARVQRAGNKLERSGA
jgi:ubiquinone biosynthesis accessory factor UbiJ